MEQWERFKTLKERGEWVELQFMAQAALRRFAVSKPWGDARAYDVGIEYRNNFLRVQVKSTSYKRGRGYSCQFMPNHHKKQDYTLKQIDLFAAYVIPVNAWYLIPGAVLLGSRRKKSVTLFPVLPAVRRNASQCECYKEAWGMLTESRRQLARHGG